MPIAKMDPAFVDFVPPQALSYTKLEVLKDYSLGGVCVIETSKDGYLAVHVLKKVGRKYIWKWVVGSKRELMRVEE